MLILQKIRALFLFTSKMVRVDVFFSALFFCFFSIFFYIFLWSTFFKMFLLLDLIFFILFLSLLFNLDKIVSSNFIFFFPKILEIAGSFFIITLFRLPFILEDSIVKEVLSQNFIFLIISCFISFIVFCKFHLLKKIVFSKALPYLIASLVYFTFFISTAYAGEEGQIVIAADSTKTAQELDLKTSLIVTPEEKTAELIPPLLSSLMASSNKDFFNIIKNNPIIEEVLPKNLVNQQGFESKELFHLALLFLKHDLLLFSQDVDGAENIKVFFSKEKFDSFTSGKDKSNFFAIFKENDNWFYASSNYPAEPVTNAEILYFFNHGDFISYTSYLKDMPYRNLSLGDVILQNKSTTFVEVFELKTRDQKKPDYQFLEIKKHLNSQIFYPSSNEAFQRKAFTNISYRSHSNIFFNDHAVVSLFKNNLLQRKYYQNIFTHSLDSKVNLLDSKILPSFFRTLKR